MKSYIAIGVLLGALFVMSSSHAGQGNDGMNCNGSGSCGQTTNNAGGQIGNVTSNSAANNSIGNVTTGPSTAIIGDTSIDVRSSSANLNSNEVNSNITVRPELNNLQGQQQSTSNSNNSTSNTTVNVAGDTFEAKRIPVATAYANAPLPSATCRSGAALGVQGMGFGISGGGDKAVKTCEINEAARIAATVLNDTLGATYIFCQNEHAKVMPACKAIADNGKAETVAGNHSVTVNPLALK